MNDCNSQASDCLIIGFNDFNFQQYVEMVKSFGADSGAYQDLDLAMVTVDGRHCRALEVLSKYRNEGSGNSHAVWHNVDFLWPTITYLGSFLADRALTFDYVNLFHHEKEKLKSKLLTNNILTIAITTTLYVIPDPIIEIVEFIRQFNQTAKIIIGGPYIGNLFLEVGGADLQRMLKLLGADIYVNSTEGEQTLVNIIKALKNGGHLEGITNIAYREDGGYKISPTMTEGNPLEGTPIQYGLFPKDDLGEFVSLRTAKSCPFACSFCGFPQRAGKYNYTPVAFVEQELNKLRDLGGVTTLTFLDDTFNVPLKRFEEILRMMIRNKYGFRWNSFLRSDHVTEQSIELMGQAGCDGVFLGVESGSDTMLEKMNKTSRVMNYSRAIPLLKAAGIFTHANLIIGYPGETMETFAETYDFVERLQPDTFRAQLWYADPRTPVWRKKTELGIQGYGFNWSHATMDWQTACHLIEKMFLSIQHSIWLPQNGFELWSVYYLQRKGMSLSQIKTFIKCFNAVIREKLICHGREEIHPVLLENLIKSCRYDSEPAPVEQHLYSTAEYREAEAFWNAEFCQGDKEQTVPGESGSSSTPADSLYFKTSPEISTGLKQAGMDFEKVLLAAFVLALAKWRQRNHLQILVELNDSELLPLGISIAGEPILEIIQRLEAMIVRARKYTNYTLHFLNKKGPMKDSVASRSGFEFGYEFSTGRLREVGEAETASGNPATAWKKSLKLQLIIMKIEPEIRVRFLYNGDSFPRADVEQLVMLFKSTLSEAEPGLCVMPLAKG